MQKANGELVPGGLAMVVGFKNDPSNLGMIVNTEYLAVTGEKTPSGVVYSGSGGWLCTGEGLAVFRNGAPVVAGYAYIGARNLMPINPEADPLHVSEREKCQA